MSAATDSPQNTTNSSNTSRFRLFTASTALVGVLAFCVADGKPLLLGLAVVAALFSRAFSKSAPPLRLPRGVLNGLVIVSLLYSAAMVMIRSNVISDLTDFLTIVLMLKLFDRSSMRDEAQLLGLSMFVVIGAVLTGAQLALGLTLVLYTPLIIACVIVWQVHRGYEWASSRDVQNRVLADPAITRWQVPLTRVSAVIVGLSLLAAVVGFLVIPRVAIPGGAWARPLTGAVTGFSEQIKLGSAGLLSESSEPVMDVVLKDSAEQPIVALSDGLYLRGAVLNSYDTQTGVWRNADRPMGQVSRNMSGPAGTTRLLQGNDSRSRTANQRGITEDDETDAAEPPHRARTHLTQEITIRNASNSIATPLFAVLRPVQIGFTQTVGKVEYDFEDATLRTNGEAGRLTYIVKSALDFFDDLPATVPLSVQSARITTLAAEITARPANPLDELSNGAPEIRRIARAITSHLRENFRYSLEMVAPDHDEDPIEMFLFRRKAGHCEYFASAMTALCHASGVHARIITGYVGGELNPVSGSYVIRASDAHAWVEVQTSPGRWETFDPTPPSELQHNRRSSAGVFAKLRQIWDALEMSWGNNIIAFEQSSGKALQDGGGVMDGDNLREVGRFTRKLRAQLREILPESALGMAASVAGIVAVAMSLLTLIRFALRRTGFCWPWSIGKRAGPAYPWFYANAMAKLSERGIRRPEGLTPREFASHIANFDGPTGMAMTAIVERYYSIRFGGHPEQGTDKGLFNAFVLCLSAVQPATYALMSSSISTAQSTTGQRPAGQRPAGQMRT